MHGLIKEAKKMSVIIDQFEVILDSQEENNTKPNASEGGESVQQISLKPVDVASIYMQMQNRSDRVRAH